MDQNIGEATEQQKILTKTQNNCPKYTRRQDLKMWKESLNTPYSSYRNWKAYNGTHSGSENMYAASVATYYLSGSPRATVSAGMDEALILEESCVDRQTTDDKYITDNVHPPPPETTQNRRNYGTRSCEVYNSLLY